MLAPIPECAELRCPQVDLVAQFAEQITRFDHSGELVSLLSKGNSESVSWRDKVLISARELVAIQNRASAAEREVVRLEAELAAASKLVRHDPLTGVLNRKGLEEALDAHVARICRQDSGFCVALLDIDNFKRLNDTHGHAAGDTVLVKLAHDIQSALRPEDALARYGGEEFVVVLSGASLESGKAVMQRIQSSVRSQAYIHIESPLPPVTFSCGLVQISPADHVEFAIATADPLM